MTIHDRVVQAVALYDRFIADSGGSMSPGAALRLTRATLQLSPFNKDGRVVVDNLRSYVLHHRILRSDA